MNAGLVGEANLPGLQPVLNYTSSFEPAGEIPGSNRETDTHQDRA